MEARPPIPFEHDCREGICGTCGIMINGKPHGGQPGTATCQLHMRKFSDGDMIVVEPWRAAGFPVPKAVAERAMDAAACIGCGACVAACPNNAAQLFTAAKVAHLNLLPQGH